MERGMGRGEGVGQYKLMKFWKRKYFWEPLALVESHEEPRRGATGMSPDELSSCLPATPIFSYRVTATLSIRYDSSDQTEKRPRQRMTSQNRSLLPGRKKICPKAKKRHREAYGFTRESCMSAILPPCNKLLLIANATGFSLPTKIQTFSLKVLDVLSDIIP